MIVTLTPNPSLDRTLVLRELVRGGLNRALRVNVDAGGKGVNVSVALAANGYMTTAVLPAGGPDGATLADLLEKAGVDLVVVPIESDVRSNITLVEGGGVSTKVNTPGPSLTSEELRALSESTIELSSAAAWVVACGSLPRDVSPTFYGELADGVQCRIAVDTTGEALINAIEAGVDLVKPNLHELAGATGTQPRTLGDVVEVAQSLRSRGAKEVLVSLGKCGAVLVGESVRHGIGRVSPVVSSVGAGDALLAGYLAESSDAHGALARGLAWASASCETTNTEMPSPERIAAQQVIVHDRFDPEMLVI